eukprot:15512775-Heterocapsa_arctica.AAC.1
MARIAFDEKKTEKDNNATAKKKVIKKILKRNPTAPLSPIQEEAADQGTNCRHARTSLRSKAFLRPVGGSTRPMSLD